MFDTTNQIHVDTWHLSILVYYKILEIHSPKNNVSKTPATQNIDVP